MLGVVAQWQGCSPKKEVGESSLEAGEISY